MRLWETRDSFWAWWESLLCKALEGTMAIAVNMNRAVNNGDAESVASAVNMVNVVNMANAVNRDRAVDVAKVLPQSLS
jgi:hypothetical protein